VNFDTAFDRPVPRGGYAWWYVDALAEDGCSGLAIIGFVGSVFSPYYARARARAEGAADPRGHCALNVGLYLPQRRLWSMTERSDASLERSASELRVGRSSMRWDGDRLRIAIDEFAAPIPFRIRGEVILRPRVVNERAFALEPRGRHWWRPIAPRADVEAEFESPRWSLRAAGYHDCNAGEEPLEDGFSRWQWTRAHLADGATAITYDAQPRRAPPTSLALRIDAQGLCTLGAPAPLADLERTAWGMERAACAQDGRPPRIVRTLESGPFYARTLVATSIDGSEVVAMHESLSLDRFRQPWVRALLPFRMPRNRRAVHATS